MVFTPSTFRLSDGALLRVWLSGEASDDKPLLIALHGAPGTSSHFEPLGSTEFLTERFRVLIYDARGSGESDLQGPFTNERWVADIDELRAWIGAETFVLLGGSYGGFLAQTYALEYPTRLSALILRDTWANGVTGVLCALKNILLSPRLKVDADRQIRMWSGRSESQEDLDRGIAEILPFFEHQRDAQVFEGTTTTTTPTLSEAVASNRYKTHNSAFSISNPRFDVRERLCEIKAPTLVMVGRHDPICPVSAAVEICSSISGSRLEIFEESGHNPAAEETEKFEAVVSGFLAEVYTLS